jgi:hypothetical protein
MHTAETFQLSIINISDLLEHDCNLLKGLRACTVRIILLTAEILLVFGSAGIGSFNKMCESWMWH